jgi:hypothetical protein
MPLKQGCGFYSWNPMGCSAWDSRFGQNYRFSVVGPTKPIDHVTQRSGCIPALDAINAVDESATKVLHYFDVRPENGRELQTRLSVNAWIRKIVFNKNAFIDVHVLDVRDNRVHAGTFKLHYLGPAGNGGEFFVFDDRVYQGSGAGPGSAWNQPDARTLEYRLYYQAGDQVYTDSILHAFEVQSDDVVWNAPM